MPGDIVGVGTGSTVNKFIDALATIKDTIKGKVVYRSWAHITYFAIQALSPARFLVPSG